MSRYIDTDVVLSQYGEKHFNGEITSEEYYAIKIPIDYAQTADVRENVHGDWIHKDGIYGVVFCSECDYELHINNTNFCPNCGCDMRKGETK